MAADPHVHPSKVDPWLAGIVVAAALASLISVAVFSKVGPEHAWALFGALCVTWIGIASVTWPMAYVVEPDHLLVRCGLLRWKIPLTAIREVVPSNVPTSAPAWSLDRLEIRYAKGEGRESLCISPTDKAAFMADLASSDPNLRIDGDCMRRRGVEGL